MSIFTIEKNIPVPPASKFSGESKYPFDDMKYGDSFFIASPTGKEKAKKEQLRVSNAFYKWRVRNNIKDIAYTARIVEEDGIVGVRFWILKKEQK
ncbi:DUF7303 family protein [Bergeriella denitrificans]|uniref:Uncharacterized protein n=1 Tax=Bergeriella denitrificans TaxID=494 RepID=A0A378UL06_BERDE|nr:hypothetical protein [Bergeriella denitrificans]STZ77383.1 Uncharacterised protein [Bergeriella denitrificans]STZ83003.1 Uncharacterised protein [Bergeriella denitrificans]